MNSKLTLIILVSTGFGALLPDRSLALSSVAIPEYPPPAVDTVSRWEEWSCPIDSNCVYLDNQADSSISDGTRERPFSDVLSLENYLASFGHNEMTLVVRGRSTPYELHYRPEVEPYDKFEDCGFDETESLELHPYSSLPNVSSGLIFPDNLESITVVGVGDQVPRFEGDGRVLGLKLSRLNSATVQGIAIENTFQFGIKINEVQQADISSVHVSSINGCAPDNVAALHLVRVEHTNVLDSVFLDVDDPWARQGGFSFTDNVRLLVAFKGNTLRAADSYFGYTNFRQQRTPATRRVAIAIKHDYRGQIDVTGNTVVNAATLIDATTPYLTVQNNVGIVGRGISIREIGDGQPGNGDDFGPISIRDIRIFNNTLYVTGSDVDRAIQTSLLSVESSGLDISPEAIAVANNKVHVSASDIKRVYLAEYDSRGAKTRQTSTDEPVDFRTDPRDIKINYAKFTDNCLLGNGEEITDFSFASMERNRLWPRDYEPGAWAEMLTESEANAIIKNEKVVLLGEAAIEAVFSNAINCTNNNQPTAPVGEVAEANCSIIRGMAIDPSNKGRVAVDVYIDDEFYSREYAHWSAGQVFDFQPPEHIKDGLVHSFRLHALDDGVAGQAGNTVIAEFPLSCPTASIPLPPIGTITHASCDIIEGFAFDPNGTGKTGIHIYVDNQFKAGFYANERNEDVPREDKYHGFSWSIPNYLNDGQRHKITVYALDDQIPRYTFNPRILEFYLNCPIQDSASLPVGRVMKSNCDSILGWAYDPNSDQDVGIHVYVDGHFYTVLRASRPWYRSGENSKLKAFKWRIPDLFRTGHQRQIALYLLDDKVGGYTSNPLIHEARLTCV